MGAGSWFWVFFVLWILSGLGVGFTVEAWPGRRWVYAGSVLLMAVMLYLLGSDPEVFGKMVK